MLHAVCMRTTLSPSKVAITSCSAFSCPILLSEQFPSLHRPHGTPANRTHTHTHACASSKPQKDMLNARAGAGGYEARIQSSSVGGSTYLEGAQHVPGVHGLVATGLHVDDLGVAAGLRTTYSAFMSFTAKLRTYLQQRTVGRGEAPQ